VNVIFDKLLDICDVSNMYKDDLISLKKVTISGSGDSNLYSCRTCPEIFKFKASVVDSDSVYWRLQDVELESCSEGVDSWCLIPVRKGGNQRSTAWLGNNVDDCG
jgi:hypothetical protein